MKTDIEIVEDYIDYYKKNKPSIINDIRNFLASETILILIIVFTLIVIFLILKTSDEVGAIIHGSTQKRWVQRPDNVRQEEKKQWK